MKLGLYGGSFDPVHNGHLLLARDALEILGLERVFFLPAARSPHKLHREPLPGEVRLKLLRCATAGEPGFEVDDRELRRAGISYTINTVREFRSEYPDAELYYFIGDDNLRELHTWKDIDELRHLVRFVVFARIGVAIPPEFIVVRRQVAISSTEVRERLERGASIRYLVPDVCLPILQRCTKA
jgi:nicotinate-nucleotide adenylyltransferase